MPVMKFPSLRRLRIQECRKRRGYTQEELATCLGWSQPTLALYELGQRDISISKLYAISLQLGVTMAELWPEDWNAT